MYLRLVCLVNSLIELAIVHGCWHLSVVIQLGWSWAFVIIIIIIIVIVIVIVIVIGGGVVCKRADSLGCREVITTWVGLIEQEDKEVLMNIAMLSVSFMIV